MSVPRRYQTFWPRLWAGYVDAFVLAPVAFADYWIWTISVPMLMRAVCFVALRALGLAYTILLHGWYGATLGKQLLQVRVLDVSERPLTMRQAVLRDLPGIVTNVWFTVIALRVMFAGGNIYRDPIWSGWFMWASWGVFALELVTMLTNQKRRALHDLIAGSVVVRVQRESSPGTLPNTRRPMVSLPAPWAATIAAAVGVVGWLVISHVTNQRGAWDGPLSSPLFSSSFFPALLAFEAVLGYLAPQGAWRWGFAPFAAQAIVALIQSPAGNLFPLGLILFAILGAVAALPALAGAALRRRLAPIDESPGDEP